MTERTSRKNLIRQQRKMVAAFSRLAFVCKIATAVLLKENLQHDIFNVKAGVFSREHLDAIMEFANSDEYTKVMESVDKNIKRESDSVK